MQCIKLYLLTMTWCSILRSSSQCLSLYITRAIDSYHCLSSSFMSISNIRFQQCTRACLINSTCWTLSYNHSGHVCVLGEEACITANNSNDFSMMIIRTDSSQRCLEWMPFNMTYGVNYGYPKHATCIKARMGQDKVSTVARRVTSDVLQIGKSPSFRYKAYVLDLRQNRHAIDYGYEILLVGNSCSTAWVPFTAGDPTPTGAVTIGEDILTGTHYIVGTRATSYMYFTSYKAGAAQAFYTASNSVASTTNMYMLILLA